MKFGFASFTFNSMINPIEDLGLPLDYATQTDVFLKLNKMFKPVGTMVSGFILKPPISQAIKEAKPMHYT